MCDKQRKILLVANVAKEHVLKFHIPTIQLLKKDGWQVDVACNADAPVPYCDHLYAAKWERNPLTLKTFRGIRQLKQIFENVHYDVVYCHTPVGGFVGRIATKETRKNGTKVIYFAHGFHFFDGAPKQNWLFYPIEKWLSYKTDAMFLINDEDYQRASEKFNKNLFLKQYPGIGVDFERIKVSDPEAIRERYRNNLKIDINDLVLIYVAELTKNKNQGYLLSALKEILKKRNNVKLLLVGPDHADNLYKRYVEMMGLEDNVIFTGWRNDIGALLCASDICVASSIREGFGINLVEAMYHGLPVVAVKNRGHSTVIKDGENGFLVPLDNSSKMAWRVLQIIDNEKMRTKLSHIDVSQYEAKKVAEDIVATIQTIVSM